MLIEQRIPNNFKLYANVINMGKLCVDITVTKFRAHKAFILVVKNQLKFQDLIFHLNLTILCLRSHI